MSTYIVYEMKLCICIFISKKLYRQERNDDECNKLIKQQEDECNKLGDPIYPVEVPVEEIVEKECSALKLNKAIGVDFISSVMIRYGASTKLSNLNGLLFSKN